VLDHLKIDRAHLVGLSMGAYSSLQIGLNASHRALSMTLAGVGSGSEIENLDNWRRQCRTNAEQFETLGSAEVRQIFRASRVGTIAGSHVTEGRITRGSRVRLIRDGTVVYDGVIASLRRFNEDVREVASGFDCGIVLRDFADLKEGDVLEAYTTRQVERELA